MADNLSGWAALVGCQFPALIGLAVLAATRKHFPLPPFAYGLILLHCWILFLGAHYTYAEVNTFRFIRDLFGWQRNNYDKLGHFAQGFVPAIIAREILLRNNVVSGRGWLNFFVISVAWLSVLCTNCLNGSLPSSPVIPPRVFSPPRVCVGYPI